MTKYKMILLRNLRIAWSFPVWLIISLMQPVFWLVMYGVLMKNLEIKYGSGLLTYMTYFSTGIIAGTAVFSSLWSGITIMQDLQNGILNRLMWSNCSKTSIIAAYVTQSLISILFQCAIIMLISIYMGAKLELSIITIMNVTLAILLLGMALTSLSHFISLLLKKQEAMISVVTFITMPIFFISGILSPIESTPGWFSTLAWINPAHHGVEIIRYILLMNYSTYAHLWESITYLSVFTLIFFSGSLLFLRVEV